MHAYDFCNGHVKYTTQVMLFKTTDWGQVLLFIPVWNNQLGLERPYFSFCHCLLWVGKVSYCKHVVKISVLTFRRSRLYRDHHQPALILLRWHSQPTPRLLPLPLWCPPPPALWPSPLPQSQVSQPPSPPWVLPVSWCTLMRISRWWVLEFCSDNFFWP